MEFPHLLTFSEVCDRLRVSPKTLRKLIMSGEIKAARIGERPEYRIAEQEVTDYLKRQAVEVPAS